jgi:hypothetical protein
VAALSRAWLCGRLSADIAGLNPPGGVDVCLLCCMLSSRVCCAGWSLVQGSYTECGLSGCDCETSTMRRPWHIRSCRTTKRNIVIRVLFIQTSRILFIFSRVERCMSSNTAHCERPLYLKWLMYFYSSLGGQADAQAPRRKETCSMNHFEVLAIKHKDRN